jgi:hypothetical protein
VIPHLYSTAGFDPVRAKAWMSTNFALQKAIEVFQHVQGIFDKTYDACMSSCDAGFFTFCPVCSIPVSFNFIATNLAFAVKVALDISEKVYEEIVDSQDSAATAEQDSAVYENVITIHGNVIAMHKNLDNVFKIVTGIDTGLKKKQVIRRLQVINCTNTTLSGYVDNCSKPSCENPTKLCDGSFNYHYISQLAGGEYHNRTMGYLCILSCAAHT